MVAICKDTFAYLAKEADACAAGAADKWAKLQWRSVAAAYRELVKIEPEPMANAAEQTEASKGRARDNPLGMAEHYLERAAKAHDLGLKETLRKRRENLIALAENYYLLHYRFVQLGRLHQSNPSDSDREFDLHPTLSCVHE